MTEKSYIIPWSGRVPEEGLVLPGTSDVLGNKVTCERYERGTPPEIGQLYKDDGGELFMGVMYDGEPKYLEVMHNWTIYTAWPLHYLRRNNVYKDTEATNTAEWEVKTLPRRLAPKSRIEIYIRDSKHIKIGTLWVEDLYSGRELTVVNDVITPADTDRQFVFEFGGITYSVGRIGLTKIAIKASEAQSRKYEIEEIL